MSNVVVHMAPSGEMSWKIGVLLSALFHVAFFIAVPVGMALARNSERFEHVQTFQLVTAPSSLKPYTPARPKLAKPVRSTVKKESTRPVPGNERVSRQENIEELASLLDEMTAPTRVAVAGEFKYDWYLANITQKISRYWTPATENKTMSVQVSFTIHRDGSISDLHLSKPSGNSTLDNLALRAINLAAPFGKMPTGFSGNKIDLTVTLIPTMN